VLQFSEDGEEDPDGAFPRKYVALLTTLCANYDFMLVSNNFLSEGLFGLLKTCARSHNLRLAISSLDFWMDFKETVSNCKLGNELTILNEFKEVSQIMLAQSALVSSIPYEQLTTEEIEELETTEKGVSLSRFREYTADILLKTYLLLQESCKQVGEKVIYDMLTAGLQPGNDAKNLEVLFFAAKSIYDGFDDENWSTDTLSFISAFFSFIIQEPAT
jgi:hypothetical protein